MNKLEIYNLSKIIDVAIDSHDFTESATNDFIKYHRHKIWGSEVLIKHDQVINSTVIGFAGTNEWRDWITNLHVNYVEIADYRLHAGFYYSFLGLLPEILKHEFIFESKVVYMTGFSQGGALAQIAAHILSQQFSKRVEVFIFGSPKIGTQPFKKQVSHIPIHRYWFRNDLITYTPWCYTHVGTSKCLGTAVTHNPHDVILYKERVLEYESKLSTS